jgi:hypothetical protein
MAEPLSEDQVVDEHPEIVNAQGPKNATKTVNALLQLSPSALDALDPNAAAWNAMRAQRPNAERDPNTERTWSDFAKALAADLSRAKPTDENLAAARDLGGARAEAALQTHNIPEFINAVGENFKRETSNVGRK